MQNKKILVADDDAGIAEVITHILTFAGYEVNSTLKGEEILSLQKDLPDLLVLDIWLSGFDGRVICKQLKHQSVTKDIIIILMSASNEMEKSALASGANGFIAKPFEMNALIDSVKNHLEKIEPLKQQ